MPEAKIQVNIKKLHEDAILPTYATEGSSGADLYALEQKSIFKGYITTIRTGIAIELPEGYEAQIRPRSGLAANHGIIVVNAPGTIDSDYRSEIMVIMTSISADRKKFEYIVEAGERIAQLVIAPVTRAKFTMTGDLSPSKRGTGGLGSTGRF